MGLPIAAVEYPPELDPNANGKLTDAQLTTVPMAGRTARCLTRVAPAVTNLIMDCYNATGLVLTITSDGDSYRSLQSQTSLFLQRYRKGSGPGGIIPSLGCQLKSKKYQGTRWWLLKNMATAATPGTSNHGLGLAFDFAWWINGGVVGIQSQSKGWNWLLTHAAMYGFSWELQEEPWHLRYVAGANPPRYIPLPIQQPKGDDVYGFVRKQGKNAVWLGNMVTRIWIETPQQQAAKTQALIFNGVPASSLSVHVVESDADLDVWGTPVGTNPGDV